MRDYRKRLLDALRKAGERPIHFREIVSLVEAPRGDRAFLRELLMELVASGEVARLKGGVFAWGGASGTVRGRISLHRDGFGFVTPETGGDDIFIPAKNLAGAMHGDTVELRIGGRSRPGARAEGRIISVVQRGTERLVGLFQSGRKNNTVLPSDPRIAQSILVPAAAGGDARDGQVVHLEMTSYPGDGRPAMGRVLEVLGWPDDPDVEVLSVIRTFDLPAIFPPAVIREAQRAPQEVREEEWVKRTDLRHITTVTIDGETARDFDDAVAVRREADGSIRLWVSIADVSHYVSAGSALDREAFLRGTSVYFPGRCLPMLPEELSNGICSLNPKVERLAMTAEMLFDRAGVMQDSSFYPSVILSDARLTYTVVRQILEDRDQEARTTHADLLTDLEMMEELARRLMKKRHGRGSIDFDLPEPEIILDLQGRPEAIIRSERNLAHRIIEEFMLAANEAVAARLDDGGYPCLFRIHEPPSPDKLEAFAELAGHLGYVVPATAEGIKPGDLQKLIEQAEGKPEERLVNEVLLRSMKQARYSAENLGHFGLAAERYAHFTSPIRRYPDLVVHRLLRDLLSLRPPSVENLSAVAEHTSSRERVAMEAEREVVTLKKLQFMAERVGEEYEGIISSVAAFGVFVELTDYFIDGLLHISLLPADFYRFDDRLLTLTGERSKQIYRIGDTLKVRVAAVSIPRRQIDFVLADMPLGLNVNVPREEYPRVPVKGKRPSGMKGAKVQTEEKGRRKKGGKGTPRPGRRR
jgi:ribonuclease R